MGVPYGTSYWQVGDSSEQNGCFKMALTKYKRELLRQKELAGIEFGINKEDITYLVSQAWADSFARVVHNKSAIADRGWNPLNYIVCFTLKSLQQGTQEDLLLVTAILMMRGKMLRELQRKEERKCCNY